MEGLERLEKCQRVSAGRDGGAASITRGGVAHGRGAIGRCTVRKKADGTEFVVVCSSRGCSWH